MKNAIIRITAIAVLATSMSVFAQSDQAKVANNKNPDKTCAEETTASFAVDQPKASQDEQPSDQDEQQSNQDGQKSKEQQQIKQQDKEWLHDLQGIYGG